MKVSVEDPGMGEPVGRPRGPQPRTLPVTDLVGNAGDDTLTTEV